MGLDLEEYDFDVEFIRRRENTESQTIMKIITRLQTRRKTTDEISQPSSSFELKVYERITTLEHSKMLWLHLSKNKLIILKGGKNFPNLCCTTLLLSGSTFSKA